MFRPIRPPLPGRRKSGLCPQPVNETQRCSLSDSVSTARIRSDGRQFRPRHNLKTVSTVGIRRPRSISETYPRSISAISASFSCVIPASRLNRARICPTMRFKSCGSSKGFKPSSYQEPRRISSHYSTIVLAMDTRSQELPVDHTVLNATALRGRGRANSPQRRNMLQVSEVSKPTTFTHKTEIKAQVTKKSLRIS